MEPRDPSDSLPGHSQLGLGEGPSPPGRHLLGAEQAAPTLQWKTGRAAAWARGFLRALSEKQCRPGLASAEMELVLPSLPFWWELALGQAPGRADAEPGTLRGPKRVLLRPCFYQTCIPDHAPRELLPSGDADSQQTPSLPLGFPPASPVPG